MRALLLLLCSCSSPITEALVTVSASGLQVGVDINRLHFSATDTTSTFTGFDQTLLLCPDRGARPPGCTSLPLSVVLYPGPRSPQDSVRVVVDGLRDATAVLSSVAVLTFTVGVRERLDFVLYGTCLNRLDCAGSDTVCDANGNCVHLMTTMDTPDLAHAEDLASSLDLAGVDLAAPDLATVDLAAADLAGCGDSGQVCCANAVCNDISLACYNGSCQPCGAQDDWCCPQGDQLCNAALGCDQTFHCTTCGKQDEPCCAGNSCVDGICSQGICQPAGCGNPSQPCCPNGQCLNGVACEAEVCMVEPCITGAICCGAVFCTSGNICYQGSCDACGSFQTQACLTSQPCDVPFQPDPFAGVCQLCDVGGYPCCGGKNGVCSAGLSCNSGTCG